MIKTNGNLKKIEPFKYNGIFSIHNKRSLSKEKNNNFPMLNTFSRNFNKNLYKTTNAFKTSINNKNLKNNFSNHKTQEFSNTLQNIPYPGLRLSHYIKSSNFKNKKKINNNITPSSKVNEVYFNLTNTEISTAHSRNGLNMNLEMQTKLGLKKNRNKSKKFLDNNINKQKEEKEDNNTIDNSKKENKIINDFSYVTFQQIIPNPSNSYIKYNNSISKTKKIIKKQILNNLRDKNTQTNEQSISIIKNNNFFETVLEGVLRDVEYKNQQNQEISINIVKNLLNNEIASLWNDSYNNNNINDLLKLTEDYVKNNKSFLIENNNSNNNNDNILNKTYNNKDNSSKSNTNLHNEIEKMITRKLIKRYPILNRKFEFKKNNNIEKNENYPIIKSLKNQNEENNFRKRKNIHSEDEKLGQLILSIGKDINENLNDFKNKKFDYNKTSIFESSNMTDILNKFMIKTGKRHGLHTFKGMEFTNKKNLDINEYKNDIIDLYKNFLLFKDNNKQSNQINQNSLNKTKNKNEELLYNKDNSDYSNIISKDKDKNQKIENIKKKFNSNMPVEEFISLIENDKEFETFINNFGGYYPFGDIKNIKEILQKMKKPNIIPTLKYLNNTSKDKSKNDNINSPNYKEFLNKTSERDNTNSSNTNRNYNTNKRNRTRNKHNNFENNNTENSNNNNILSNLVISNEEEKSKSIKNLSSNEKSKEDIENNLLNKEHKKRQKKNKKDKNKKSKKDIKKEKEIILKIEEEKENKKNEVNYEKKNDVKIEEKKEKIKLKVVKYNYVKSNIDQLKKNRFDLDTIYNNGDLNELEKQLLLQTNNLNNLNKKDKEKILNLLNQIEIALENERNGTNNIYNRIKIKNLHYEIMQNILDLYNRGLIKPNSKKKGSKDILEMIKRYDFYEKQRRMQSYTSSGEEEDEKEDDNEYEINKRNILYDDEIDRIFRRQKKRSRSVNIKKFKSYYKSFYYLLFKKVRNIKKPHKSARHRWERTDSKKYSKKKIKFKESKKKLEIYKKKRRGLYDGRMSRKKLMAYENYAIPLSAFYNEEDEIEQYLNEERKKRLKKEMTEKKIKDFFQKIQRLKNVEIYNYEKEKELKILVDEQLNRLEYAKKKDLENRVNNFIQELDFSRSKEMYSKLYRSQRMHYISPIIFFTKKKDKDKSNTKK